MIAVYTIVMTEYDSNPRYCSHRLEYEKKSMKITWLRCSRCNSIVGWLEENRLRIEGKPVKLSYSEKIMLK